MSDWYMGRMAERDRQIAGLYDQHALNQERAFAFPKDAATLPPTMGELAQQYVTDPLMRAGSAVADTVRNSPWGYLSEPEAPGALASRADYDPHQRAALQTMNAARPIDREGRKESEESRAAYNDPYRGLVDLGISALPFGKAVVKPAIVAGGALAASAGDAIAGPIKRAADRLFAPGSVMSPGERVDPRLWSPLSKQKLTKPLSEMEHFYKDVRYPTPKIIDPAQLRGGHLILTPSDLSASNRTLTRVDTQKLDRPVRAEGGVGFPEANPGMAWASEPPIARRLDNLAAELSETGKPVYIAPMTMSPQGIDASHHVADPLSQLLKQAPVTKANVKAFNDMMREEVRLLEAKKKDPTKRREWVNTNSPRFEEFINNLEGGMKIKSKMAEKMAMEQWQSKGFPNVAAVRHAMSEPSLIDQPRNTFGMAISRYTPGKGLLETSHPSYGSGVAGQHMGQLASLLPFDVGAYQIAQPLAALNAANKAAGKTTTIQPAYHLGKPSPGVPTHQELTDEWLDRIMAHQRARDR